VRKPSVLSVIALLLLGVFVATPAGAAPADGTIVETTPCAVAAKRTYEQYVKEQRAALDRDIAAAAVDGFKPEYVDKFDRFLLSREEFERREAFTDYECRKIKYMSDGLKVVGFIWKPSNTTGKQLPLVIVTRGGNPNLGLLSPQQYYYPFVTNGFVLIGSQYRGTDGGEGQDEFGGADVNDVLNLIPLARSLGYVDMNNVFVFGHSRGSMEAFQAIKKGLPINAVAVTGSLTDMTGPRHRPGVTERVTSKLIPGFAENHDEVLRERSAVFFADKINVPVLIFHGGADWRGDAGKALAFASKLQSLGKTYEMHVYAGDDHPLSMNRLERDRKIVEWFRTYMK
jgi:dipeptidyl aminopeptidase/acylaminoacyl peptidase